MSAFLDLTNKKFGYWTVTKRVKVEGRSHTLWECVCRCGAIKHVLSTHLVREKTKSCGCNKLKGEAKNNWTGYGDISGSFWKSIMRGASGNKGRRQKVEFSITIEYAWSLFLKQNKKCALSGKDLFFNFSRSRGNDHTASLDRIDNEKGYIEGNVQWVHKDVNMMKRTYDNQYFINICCMIAKNRI